MDQYLLEAMREVDAMLPGTTPITPPEPIGFPHEFAEFNTRMANLRNLYARGVSYNSGQAAMLAGNTEYQFAYLAAQANQNVRERNAALAGLQNQFTSRPEAPAPPPSPSSATRRR